MSIASRMTCVSTRGSVRRLLVLGRGATHVHRLDGIGVDDLLVRLALLVRVGALVNELHLLCAKGQRLAPSPPPEQLAETHSGWSTFHSLPPQAEASYCILSSSSAPAIPDPGPSPTGDRPTYISFLRTKGNIKGQLPFEQGDGYCALPVLQGASPSPQPVPI